MTLTSSERSVRLSGMTDSSATPIPHGTASGFSYHKCRCDQCKAWKQAKDKAYYEANKEKVKARVKKYADENRDVVRERVRAHYEANAEQIAQQKAEYYRANKEAVYEKVKAWRVANPERAKQINAAYRERNREQLRIKNLAYYYERMRNDPEAVRKTRLAATKTPRGIVSSRSARHKRRGAPLTAESKAWWLSLVDPLCTYCGDPATTIDHIIPLSKGGSGERENLTPACKRCNSRKNQMSVEDFLKLLREEGGL